MTHRTTLASPIGPLEIEVDGKGALVRVEFLSDEDAVSESGGGETTAVVQLTQYFGGQRTVFDLDLAPTGTEFERLVWNELLHIPFGTTDTYGEIARRLGDSGASRAVGTANARNPIAIIVPCHRVIGSDGSLTGYAGGLWRKKWLLAHESGQRGLEF